MPFREIRLSKITSELVENGQRVIFYTIEVAIGERENIRKKPAPDTVLEALRQLGASKDGAVYIGDSDVDVMTAKNSGLPCISVLWGFRDKEFLIEHGATLFVESPHEILAKL